MGEGKLRTEMPLARVLGVVDEDRVGLLDELGSAVLDQCSVKEGRRGLRALSDVVPMEDGRARWAVLLVVDEEVLETGG